MSYVEEANDTIDSLRRRLRQVTEERDTLIRVAKMAENWIKPRIDDLCATLLEMAVADLKANFPGILEATRD